MNEQIKRKWVKALRSGKYKQVTGTFYSEGRYCCLGVLACVTTGLKGYKAAVAGDNEWIGQRILKFSDQRELALLNDSGATFDQIAMCIENGL